MEAAAPCPSLRAMTDLIARHEPVDFTPTRSAGLARLDAFRARMGRHYASARNSDFGPQDRSNVSALSPWVRTRTLLERELAEAALQRFALSTAEKFVQEVCWRTYFKGWLEHRPSTWALYTQGRDRALEALERNAGLRTAYQEATGGRTGLDGFDAWARELVETGYLHNHARMWFASIWLFTLKLPLELGADFFLQHLMDGDAASNTLSWRWVGGLHTPGKTYLARRSNIEKYTDGRFSPTGLAASAPPLEGPANPGREALREGDALPEGEVALLLTEEDLNPETLLPAGTRVTALAGAAFADQRSPSGAGDKARAFARGALDDALQRGGARFDTEPVHLPGEGQFLGAAEDWAAATGCRTVVTGFPPVGWVRPHLDALRARLASRDIRLLYARRDWDSAFWPHASRGFFGLKKQIPSVLAELGLPV